MGIEQVSDLTLAHAYKYGMDEAAEVLFERHRKFLDYMASNTVSLPPGVDKRSIVYLTFLNALPAYARRNGASFHTFMHRCIKNALLDEARKIHALKRMADADPRSLADENVMKDVERIIHRRWSQTGRYQP